VLSALKFMCVTVSGWLASSALSPRSLLMPCAWSCLTLSLCAAALGRSGRPGLAEASRSEPFAPRSAALPHAATIDATAAALPLPSRLPLLPRVTTWPLPTCCSHTRICLLHRAAPSLARLGAVRMWPCMPPSLCQLWRCGHVGHAVRMCVPIG